MLNVVLAVAMVTGPVVPACTAAAGHDGRRHAATGDPGRGPWDDFCRRFPRACPHLRVVLDHGEVQDVAAAGWRV